MSRRFVSSALVVLTGALLAAHPAAAQPHIYVGGFEYVGKTDVLTEVQTVDPVSGRVVRSLVLSLSINPGTVHLTVSPDGQRLYARLSGHVVTVDLVGNAIVGTTSAPGDGPAVLSPDAQWLYVPGSSGTAGVLNAMSTSSLTLDKTLTVDGRPVDVAISGNGRLYLTTQQYVNSVPQGARLLVIDPETFTLSSTIALGQRTGTLAVSPDGSRAYHADPFTETISVIDPATGSVIATLSYPVGDSGGYDDPRSTGLALTPDGTTLYITDHGNAWAFDVASLSFTRLNVRPHTNTRPAVTPDGTRVYFRMPGTAVDSLGSVVMRVGETEPERTFALSNRAVSIAFPPAVGCTFEVPDRDLTISAAGGTGTVTIPAPAGCSWNLDASATTFVQFTSATSGVGPGSIAYTVAAHTGSAPNPRVDVVRVNGQDVQFRQMQPAVVVDAYADGAFLMQNARLSGWAIDPTGTSGTGVDAVHVWAYPNPGSGQAPIFVGAATYGMDRLDVLKAGMPLRYVKSGYELKNASMPPGRYLLVVFARSTHTGAFSLVRALSVTVAAGITIDTPADGGIVTLPFQVAGWALDRGATTGTGTNGSVTISAAPVGIGPETYLGSAGATLPRPDVGAAFGEQFTNSGFSTFARPTESGPLRFTAGTWRIIVRTTSTVHAGNHFEREVTVTVRKPRQVTIDTLADGGFGVLPLRIAGWALECDADSGSGIAAVHLWAFPAGGGTPRFLGHGVPALPREDIGALFGSQYLNTGFEITAAELPNGEYFIVAYAQNTITGRFDDWHVVRYTVRNFTEPAMVLDGVHWNGSNVFVGGWALDGRAATGTGVDAVHVWAWPAGGGVPTFLGAAGLHARPDVAQVFGARFLDSGFSGSLPPPAAGTYDVVVYARSTFSGQFDQSRVWRIVIP